MKQVIFLLVLLGILCCFSIFRANAEDPYRYYTWVVTYGTRAPLGVYQRVILINNQFPGPPIEAVTNDNIIVNVINQLDEPFLITWHGIKQRKTSWQDGLLGTNCPIPPHSNWTYKFQLKDQIGTYMYYPSISMHRAIGGFGAVNVNQRSVISIPYPAFAGDFTLLIGDWYKAGDKALRKRLNSGLATPLPDGLINGLHKSSVFTGQKGKTYRFRITNVGISTSINFRIQGHSLILVEVEGSHSLQEVYESIDIHPGQSITALVTLRGAIKDYYIVASTRFTKPILTTTGILRYQGSDTPPSLPLPIAPTYHVHWSMKQARTIRLNLTANAARPNPQGTFHYGQINIVRRLVLANAKVKINGKLRYTVNGISYVDPTTPLKLADWFNIPGVFSLNNIKDLPTSRPPALGVSVFDLTHHPILASQRIEYGGGKWTTALKKRYNLVDAISRHTVEVYPNSWTAVLVSLDNKGMWNLRSQIWSDRFLGKQTYLRVWNDEKSLYTETDIPPNALRCGKAIHL
ncbi:hypothetical protein ES319_A12G070700v1 [Gossypium barbadense]|uniref:Plastocyanin-like domain-containing protein n=1 Tax=Gossypium barbadense TaxID=3634 RepID=A0A5J5T7J8_GOSBA|nr:hypothetical protein ES319_A12G070700v1 [Gossypium barbadense]